MLWWIFPWTKKSSLTCRGRVRAAFSEPPHLLLIFSHLLQQQTLTQCTEAASYQSLKYTYPWATGKFQSKLCKLRATSLISQAENCRTLEGIFSVNTHSRLVSNQLPNQGSQEGCRHIFRRWRERLSCHFSYSCYKIPERGADAGWVSPQMLRSPACRAVSFLPRNAKYAV